MFIVLEFSFLKYKNFFTRIITGTVLFLLFILIFKSDSSLILNAFFIPMIYLGWRELLNLQKQPSFFWNVYFIGAFCTLFAIEPIHMRLHFIALLFVLASLHDIGGYIFGSLFGRHKIVPHISPKKTWEGFIGSLFFVIAGIFFYKRIYFPTHFFSCNDILLGSFCCVLSFIGDISISFLKRKAGVKDTGALLPGHGGILDRIDSVIPLLWLFWLFPFLFKF